MDQASDKLFELFVACLTLRCGTNVEVDDPVRSNGSNPDVLATIGGRRWGFACKALRSLHPEAIIDHIRKGVDQIERSPAELGVVVFSLKEVLDHERYWGIVNPDEWQLGAEPLYKCFRSGDEPTEQLKLEAQLIGRKIVDSAGKEAIADLFKGKKARPAFLQWANVVAGVVVDGLPHPATLRFFNLQWLEQPSQEDMAVYECLSRVAQTDPVGQPF